MEQYTVTSTVKDEATVRKELERLVKGMLIPRLLRKTYQLEEVKKIYVPYMLGEYKVKHKVKNKKTERMGIVYISMEVNTSRKKAFTTIEDLMLVEGEKGEVLANALAESAELEEEMRRELVFKVLPRNLKAWKEHDILKQSSVSFYRPLYLVRYRLFGRMRVYQTFGDQYNL